MLETRSAGLLAYTYTLVCLLIYSVFLFRVNVELAEATLKHVRIFKMMTPTPRVIETRDPLVAGIVYIGLGCSDHSTMVQWCMVQSQLALLAILVAK
jgi:hypothetical protein